MLTIPFYIFSTSCLIKHIFHPTYPCQEVGISARHTHDTEPIPQQIYSHHAHKGTMLIIIRIVILLRNYILCMGITIKSIVIITSFSQTSMNLIDALLACRQRNVIGVLYHLVIRLQVLPICLQEVVNFSKPSFSLFCFIIIFLATTRFLL